MKPITAFPLTRWLTIALASSLGVLVMAQSAYAFPPPAGMIQQLLGDTRCEIAVSLSTDQTSYRRETSWPLTTVVLAVKFERKKGAIGPIRVTLPTPSQLTYSDIDALTAPGSVVVESTSPNLVVRTSQGVESGKPLTALFDYQIKADAPLGPVNLTATPENLASTGNPLSCQTKTSGTVSFSLQSPVRFDLAPIFTAPRQIVAGEYVTVTGQFKNEASAADSVPVNTGLKLELTYPTSFTFDNGQPTSSYSNNKITWQVTTGSTPLAPGATYPTTFSANFFVDPGYIATHPMTLCINPLGDWSVRHESPKDNNCSTITITESPLQVKKTWSDNQTVLRKFQPNAFLDYKISLTNISGVPVNGIRLTDILATNNSCNPVSQSGCPAWDDTVSWHPPLPQGVTELQPDNKLVWDSPISLSPNQTETMSIRTKVAQYAELIEKLNANGYQPRCNFARYTIDGTIIDQTARLCWEYDLPADLIVSKHFKTGSTTPDTLELRQGEVGTYSIGVENTGPHPAYNVGFTDRQTEKPTPANGNSGVRWVPSSITDSNMAIDDDTHTLSGWSSTQLAAGDKKTVEPQFAVTCDAPTGAFGGNSVLNVATVTAANDPNPNNNHNTNEVKAIIKPGHYNLGLAASSNPASVSPGVANKDKVQIQLVVSNGDDNQDNFIAIPGVTVTASVPSQFSVSNISPAGSFKDGTISWNTIPSLAKGEKQTLTATLTVDKNALSASPVPTVVAQAKSVSASLKASSTCGKAGALLPIPIDGPTISTVKKLVSPLESDRTASTVEVKRGDEVQFELRVSNSATEAVVDRGPNEALVLTDILNSSLDYAENSSTCQLISPPSSTNLANCEANGQPVQPSVDGQTLSWSIRKIPANTAVRYRFKATVSSGLAIADCPTPVNNQATTTDQRFTDLTYPSGPVTIRVFPDKCLDGDVHVRSTDSQVTQGITITSPEVVIGPKSILSSTGTIECGGNVSCEFAPFRIQNYDISPSVGLNFDKVLVRLHRNVQRLIKQAEPLPSSFSDHTLSDPFDLLGSDPNARVRYPEGRVYIHDGDLHIKSMNFKNTGTIIVRGGNLYLGNKNNPGDEAAIGYADESNSRHSVGFIVLPAYDSNNNLVGGNIEVQPGVVKMLGAYAATGRPLDKPGQGALAQTGLIKFLGGTTTQLRPVRGVIIGSQVVIERAKIVFEGSQLLSTVDGAPPGFQFSTSPSTTNENP